MYAFDLVRCFNPDCWVWEYLSEHVEGALRLPEETKCPGCGERVHPSQGAVGQTTGKV